MANREKGEVSLVLPDNTTLTLVLNINAQAAIEERLNKSWDTFLARILNPATAGVRDVRMLMWGMARKHHPSLTLEDVGDLIEQVGLVELSALIVEPAMQAATPDQKDVEELGVDTRPPKAGGKKSRRRNGGAASTFRPVRSA